MSVHPAETLEDASPAGRITAAVARHGEMTIADLVAELGVTTTAVRQQVNRLHARGWLTRAKRNHGPGRPADVYSLSDDGRKLFAHNVDELARHLLHELIETEGPEKLHELLARVQRRMAHDLKDELGPGAPDEQFQKLADLLRRQGTIADLTRSSDEARLSVFTCPYHGVVADAHELCELERDTLSRLTGGDVQLDQRLVDGHTCCEFKVTLAAQKPAPK